MANLLDFWLNLLVTPTMLNTLQANLEAADKAMLVDTALGGVFYGLAVSERGGGTNLSVDVSAGAAYDVDGRRCRTPSTQNVVVSADSDGTPTTVAGVGNEKWVSISIRFKRDESVPYVDGNSNPGNFVQDEGYEWVVSQGAEALVGAASRPALVADAVLLADVKLVHSQTSVLNADISTTRRQLPFDLVGSVHALKAGRVGGSGGALDQLLGWLDEHIADASGAHAASAISYAGGGTWANGTTNPATTAELQFDKIVSDLASTSGSACIGALTFSYGPTTINGATVHAQLAQVATATNLYYAGGGTWADGSTNPLTSVELQLDKIVSDLAATAASGGLAKVGCGARTAWLGGRTNPAATSFAALDKIITDLGLQDAGDDGMERIGAQASGNLAAGSARTQVDELDTRTNRSRETSVVAPAGVTANVTVAKFSYRVDGTSGGTVAISAPDAAMGPNPIVHLALVTASGDLVDVKYSGATVASFNGGADPHLPGNGIKTWMELQWTGSGWITRSWGHGVVVTLQ